MKDATNLNRLGVYSKVPSLPSILMIPLERFWESGEDGLFSIC